MSRASVYVEHGELQDRASARDDHDGKHEHGLGKALSIEVSDGGVLAVRDKHHDDEDHGPKAENNLDLAEKMPDTCVGGVTMR